MKASATLTLSLALACNALSQGDQAPAAPNMKSLRQLWDNLVTLESTVTTQRQ